MFLYVEFHTNLDIRQWLLNLDSTAGQRSGNKKSKEVQQNPGNWPLVNSDVFLDWTNSIQPDAKVKRV